MFPLQLYPERVASELAELQFRLVRGMHSLENIGEIELGASQREAVYRDELLTLYRYAPQSRDPHPVPVLVVYALVNRPYIADLQEGRSLIQGLLQRGLDVYLVVWGDPSEADRYLSLDDYINGYLDRCVGHILERTGRQRLDLLGICQGGTFSLCYTALHPDKIGNLVTTVTPVDFHAPGSLLANLVRHVDVGLLVEAIGNVPGEALNWTFLMLKPYHLIGQKYARLADVLQDRERALDFLRMEKWIFDSPDQAGEAYREFIEQFYQRNALVNGDARIGGRLVDLKQVQSPILNVYALQDHLVPPDSSRALQGLVGSKDYTALEFPGGHIGLYVSGKSQKLVPPAIADWLRQRG